MEAVQGSDFQQQQCLAFRKKLPLIKRFKTLFDFIFEACFEAVINYKNVKLSACMQNGAD